MKKSLYLNSALIASCVSFSCAAETLFSDNSLSLLRGNDYEVGDKDRTVFTYEHFSAHTWGDFFMFADRLQSDNGDRETYIELSPRLTMATFDDSFFKSVSVSTTAEIGDGFTHTLWGGAVDLNIPGFQHFALNFYHRVNEDLANNWQLTPTWAVPFKLGEVEFLYDGFIDWRSAYEDGSAEFNFTSQLKFNAGPLLGMKNKFYLGIEYVYWTNKFGIEGVDERNPNLLVKYHF